MNKEEIIGKIRVIFIDKPISKAYLFGSYARNEQTIDSDVDIVVDFEKHANLFDLINLQQNLSDLLNLKVDLLSSKGISKFILPYIEKDKILNSMKSNLGNKVRLNHILEAIIELEEFTKDVS